MATRTIRAELSGVIIAVEAKMGDVVEADDILLVMESMKMEMPILSPADGRVTTITPAKDDTVSEGDVLAVIETGVVW